MSASRDRDQDTSQNDKQSNPENPFIKFRQFADTQISSLLQGIIGLPSAFSKRTSDDPRWAGIDDGLRRRDELQARQKELKESEARKRNRQPPDEEGYQPLGEQKNESEMPTKDLPLYSAVNKSLFFHLQQPDLDAADWNDYKTPPTWGDGGFIPQFYPLKVLPHQLSSFFDRDGMTMTHCLLYNDLNSSSALRSEYSLLPYLLFSPYSPLRLGNDFHRPYNRWSDAFEDLIATSHVPRTPSLWQSIVSSFPESAAVSPQGNLHWISKLEALGYLQEKKVIHENDYEALDRNLTTMLCEAHEKKQVVVNGNEAVSNKPPCVDPTRSTEGTDRELEATQSPRTEQDMYDQFLKWASSHAIKEVFQAGEAFLSSLENDHVSGRRREEDGMPQHPSLMKEILELTKTFRELSLSEYKDSEPQQPEQSARDTRTSDSPDRVVSSSTTTEQTVHEDGMVETCVTVWKKFSSGRETSTTTHHCEDPAMNEDSVESYDSGPKESEKEGKNSDKRKVDGKAGWFWN